MKTFLSALLLAFFATTITTDVFAQKKKDEDNDRKVKIKIEVTENGKTTVKEEVIEGGNFDVEEMLEDLEVLKDIDVDIDDEEVEIIVRKGSKGEHQKFRIHIPEDGDFKFEEEERAFLGVYGGNDDAEVKGSKVEGIVEGSAAEKAGLQEGDIITGIGKESIENFDDLVDVLKDQKPGDKVKVEYTRDGKKESANVELGKKSIKINKHFEYKFDSDNFERHMKKMHHHLEMMETGEEKAFLGITNGEAEEGVVIGKVVEGSAAEKMGLMAGDKVKVINGTEINSFGDVVDALKDEKPGNDVKVEVERDGKNIDFSGELGSRADNKQMYVYKWSGKQHKCDRKGCCDENCDHKECCDGDDVRIKIRINDASKEEINQLNEKSENKLLDNNDLEINSIEFQPNPTSGEFNLSFDLPSKDKVGLKILDQSGKIVYDKNLKNFDGHFEDEISIKEYPNGIYYLTIQQNGKAFTKKVVKQ